MARPGRNSSPNDILNPARTFSVEKAMQLVKGRFSYRLGKELGFRGEVWQKGFSEVQVLGAARRDEVRAYIANNPVEAGLVDAPEKYPHCFVSLANTMAEKHLAHAHAQAGAAGELLQGLKPRLETVGNFRHD